jgi:putative hydrolase of the HAD superfamily
MTAALPYLALDADDTLWHNEPIYQATQKRFREVLFDYHDPQWVEERLNQTEIGNLQHFGYGIKGFTLSMIETAIELSEGRINATQIQMIVDMGREMVSHPVVLLDGVEDTIIELANQYQLMLLTKGDLLEVVSEKNVATYQDIMRRYAIQPDEFTMVGNSLKSDVLPVTQLGGCAIHIPYQTTWVHERVTESELQQMHYHQLEKFSELPDWLATS